jgi:hypothetical protein
MRTLKAASVALLLLLIPHEAPQAESATSDEGKAVAADTASLGAESETGDATSQPPTTDQTDVTADQQADARAESNSAKSDQRSEGKVDSDGYSWSGRSLR